MSRRGARGDVALAAFLREQHARVVGLLVLRVGDRRVAEELAQDVLVRIVERWDEVREARRPAAWVTTVALNLARSWWRRRYAEARALRRHGPQRDRVEALDPELLAVRDAVLELTPRQQEVVACRFYAQLTVAETAVAMDLSEGGVKALTHRAVAALRDTHLASATTQRSDPRGPRRRPTRRHVGHRTSAQTPGSDTADTVEPDDTTPTTPRDTDRGARR